MDGVRGSPRVGGIVRVSRDDVAMGRFGGGVPGMWVPGIVAGGGVVTEFTIVLM